MALSYNSVVKAYRVFHKIKEKHLPDLEIPSFLTDTRYWVPKQYNEAIPDKVYGYYKKADDGWENIFFWTNNPTQELISDFEELQHEVPNSGISKLDDNGMWCFGWF